MRCASRATPSVRKLPWWRRGVPVGWGDPVYGRLDADIAYAMMGINAVKGVEIGAGFRSVTQKGSEHGDELTPEGFLGNNAGGVLGGISTGQDVVVRMAVKPTSSIRLPRRTINLAGEPAIIETHGRHDPCVGIRATPIAEAMLALVLIDAALHHRAQCADVDVSDAGDSGQGPGCCLIEFAPTFPITSFQGRKPCTSITTISTPNSPICATPSMP